MGARLFTREVEAYGNHPLQVGEWFVPAHAAPRATVVLVHGGFWRPRYGRSLEEPLAGDLAGRGYLIWNIDYRSAAAPWPATLTDVAAAYDRLFSGRFASRVDPSRVAVAGHSAGGQLAAWLASRHLLPADAPGHNRHLVRPALAVPQAGVMALVAAAHRRLGDGAPQELLGGEPEDLPQRYSIADPHALVPSETRIALVHGRNDRVVPLDQSRSYLAAALAAGDPATLDVVPGGHYVHLDPGSQACDRLRDHLEAMTG